MQTNEFLGRVQNKGQLPDLDSTLRATRATLETLAERIGEDGARQLRAQLPREIAAHLESAKAKAGERFDSDEFLERVSKREGENLPVSVFHVRAVLDVLKEAVSEGESDDLLERLADDYDRLFAGVEGQMPH